MRREGRLHPVLAAHVVRGRRLRAGRRAAQDEVAVRVPEQVGEVGGAAGELLHLRQVAAQAIGLPGQPGVHGRHVEGVLVAHRARPVQSHRRILQHGPVTAADTALLFGYVLAVPFTLFVPGFLRMWRRRELELFLVAQAGALLIALGWLAKDRPGPAAVNAAWLVGFGTAYVVAGRRQGRTAQLSRA